MANPSGSNQVLTKIYNAILNAIRVHVVGSVLPDGAATEAKQDQQITQLNTLITQTDGLEGSLSSIDSKVSTAANQVSELSKLDTLISQTDGIETSLSSIDSKLSTTNSDLSSIIANTGGLAKVHAPTRIDYTTVNSGAGVSTSAYTQLVSSLSGAVKELYIFDSSGRALLLAVGGSGSEIDQVYIEPGGTGMVRLAIPASSRLSVKAVDAAATTGQLLVAFLG